MNKAESNELLVSLEVRTVCMKKYGVFGGQNSLHGKNVGQKAKHVLFTRLMTLGKSELLVLVLSYYQRQK